MRTDIGHFTISWRDEDYDLIPSFKNMRRLCDPEQMPDFYAKLFGQKVQDLLLSRVCLSNKIMLRHIDDMIAKEMQSIHEQAAFVVQCCCEKDTSALTGCVTYRGDKKRWKLGAMNHEHLLHIARAMLTHGVSGKPDRDNRAQKGKVSKVIDVYRYVEMAVAHLDMSMSEAEQLTKTQFDRLIDAKYPDAKRGGNMAPTLSEHEEAMAWLDGVNERRKAKAANNG